MEDGWRLKGVIWIALNGQSVLLYRYMYISKLIRVENV